MNIMRVQEGKKGGTRGNIPKGDARYPRQE